MHLDVVCLPTFKTCGALRPDSLSQPFDSFVIGLLVLLVLSSHSCFMNSSGSVLRSNISRYAGFHLGFSLFPFGLGISLYFAYSNPVNACVFGTAVSSTPMTDLARFPMGLLRSFDPFLNTAAVVLKPNLAAYTLAVDILMIYDSLDSALTLFPAIAHHSARPRNI